MLFIACLLIAFWLKKKNFDVQALKLSVCEFRLKYRFIHRLPPLGRPMVLKEDRKSVKAHVAMVNLTLILLCFNPFLLFSIELTVVLFFLRLYRVKIFRFLLTCKFVFICFLQFFNWDARRNLGRISTRDPIKDRAMRFAQIVLVSKRIPQCLPV